MSEVEKIIRNLLNKSLTNTKPYFINDTNPHSGLGGYAIQASEDSIIDTITTNCGGNSLSGQTIKSGHVWYLQINSITLTSGSVFIHRI